MSTKCIREYLCSNLREERTIDENDQPTCAGDLNNDEGFEWETYGIICGSFHT